METLRARLYAFAFLAETKEILAQKWRTWMRIFLWLGAIITIFSRAWVIFGILFFALLFLGTLFRRAKKSGYATFVPLQTAPDLEEVALLKPAVRVQIRATGEFSAGQQERHVILRKGEMWHVPIDEHMIMVEGAPGRFLYQFVQPDYTDKVQIGHFLFGADKMMGIKIDYQTDWSPKIDYTRIAYFVGGGFQTVKRLKRTVFLAFDDESDWLILYKSLKRHTGK